MSADVVPSASLRLRVVVAAGWLLLLTACSSLDPTPPEQFLLTGHWALDVDRSDPVGPMAAGSTSGRSGGGRGMGGGGRGGAGGPPGGGGAGGSSMMAARQMLPELFADALVITQDSTSMGVDALGFPYLDISWGEQQWRGWTLQAGWKDEVLVVRRKRDSTTLETRWQLSASGGVLTLEATLPGGRRGGSERSVRRVFIRSAPPAMPG